MRYGGYYYFTKLKIFFFVCEFITKTEFKKVNPVWEIEISFQKESFNQYCEFNDI